MTCDKWHVTLGVGCTFFQNIILQFGIEVHSFEDLEGKDQSLIESTNDKDVKKKGRKLLILQKCQWEESLLKTGLPV